MQKNVISVTKGEHIILTVDGSVFLLDKDIAIQLAARLVWEAAHDLIKRSDNNGIQEWNLDSKFFQAYRNIWL